MLLRESSANSKEALEHIILQQPFIMSNKETTSKKKKRNSGAIYENENSCHEKNLFKLKIQKIRLE